MCGRNGTGDRLERHHIFEGNPDRQLSEKYKLVVWLCGSRCHRNGEYAAHRNKDTAKYLHRVGQQMFEEQGHSREEFIKIFGRNYIE